jgi:RNA polymerase sigma-70 factor (ECF subfamily)
MEIGQALINGLLNNSRQAQRELFDLFFKPMMRVSQIYCSNEDDAKSVVLEAFMDVYTNISKYDPSRPFKTWFNSIVVHRALNHYAKYKKISGREKDIEPLMNENFDAADSSMNIISKMSADELLSAIHTLPETERIVFTLYVMEDLSHKEISDQLGFTETTSRWYYSNARKKLQEKLKKINITSSYHTNA